MPSIYQNSFIFSKTSIPNAEALPDDLSKSPVSKDIAVVLPAPL